MRKRNLSCMKGKTFKLRERKNFKLSEKKIEVV